MVAAACFAVSAFAIAAVGVRHRQVRTPAEQKATLHHAMEGLRFIRARPVLFGAIALDLFAVLFGGAVALLPAIAEDRLHVGNVGYGWLRAAPGLGAIGMAVLLAIRPLRRHIGRRLLTVVAVFGAGTVVLGLTHRYWVAFLALVVLSAADAVSVFIRTTIVPLATPDHMRGRVSAVENVFVGASNEVGSFESGVASALIGVGPAVVLGGAMTMGIVGVWSVVFPDLRDVDRFDDVAVEDHRPPPILIADRESLTVDHLEP
jgi:predicted MFS family arabinose efflux permease